MPKAAESNLPVNYADQLSKRAGTLSERINTGMNNKIRIKGNQKFISPDGQEGKTLSVITLDFVSYNAWYDRDYDADNPTPPACFAQNSIPNLLAPHESSPLKQADVCQNCPQNQWASATVGKGKACQNRRNIALIAVDKPDADILELSVSPTNMKYWDKYVQELGIKHQLDVAAVVTEIYLDEDGTYASPRFRMIRKLSPDEINQFGPRLDEASKLLLTPPDVSTFTPVGK